MERVKFSLLEHLGTFTLGKMRPAGLDKSSGSTRGEDDCIEGYLWAVHKWPLHTPLPIVEV